MADLRDRVIADHLGAVEVQRLARARDVRDDQVRHRAHHRAGDGQPCQQHRQRDDHRVVERGGLRHLLQQRLARFGGALDDLESLLDVVELAAEPRVERRHRVAARGALLVVQRHRHRGDQRLGGQLTAFVEVAAQRATAGSQHDVVDRAASGPPDRLDPLEAHRLRRDAALSADADVEDRAWRLGDRREVRILRESERRPRGARQPAVETRQPLELLVDHARQAVAQPGGGGPALGQLPGLVGPERPDETRARIRRQVQQLDAVRAVDQRMVDLAVDRESMAGEPFDDVELPQRLRQVHRVGVQARHELAELALATRVGQRRTPHVILEVGVVDDLPARHDLAREAASQPIVHRVRRHGMAAQLGEQLRDEVRGRVGRNLEDLQAGHVQRRVARLGQQERSIESAERNSRRHHVYSSHSSSPLRPSSGSARHGRTCRPGPHSAASARRRRP